MVLSDRRMGVSVRDQLSVTALTRSHVYLRSTRRSKGAMLVLILTLSGSCGHDQIAAV
jgi:hypothetical protein